MFKAPRFKTPETCPICDAQFEPTFLEPHRLKPFLTERGKVQARNRSGVCLAHQRHLSRAIRRARFMALLPYIAQVR